MSTNIIKSICDLRWWGPRGTIVPEIFLLSAIVSHLIWPWNRKVSSPKYFSARSSPQECYKLMHNEIRFKLLMAHFFECPGEPCWLLLSNSFPHFPFLSFLSSTSPHRMVLKLDRPWRWVLILLCRVPINKKQLYERIKPVSCSTMLCCCFILEARRSHSLSYL